MNAIGLIETIGYVAAIEASDACVKSANVNIVSLDKVGGGIVTLTITGDVGAVKSAVEAGETSASRVGILRSSHVIPRLHKEVADILFKKEEPKKLEVSKTCEESLNQITETKKENNDEVIEEIIEDEDKEDINKITEEVIKVNEVTNEKVDNSNIENIDVLEKSTTSDKDDLSKHSVKELKAIAKKINSTITYKELNKLKKEELINLVKKLKGEDK